ncbi:ABC transporter permease subunit [Amnibacterium flavum]|uniref:ABC transporter permease n=1 Tax=Amnibacterium flavum TaxID=2173173 RepID=A0A2V1HR54_9MICO|nr:ABC transporter permease subunit [Amnibacterium flavum]PVZ95018.1 ABC transporter permease [Amnibacterium flavum]
MAISPTADAPITTAPRESDLPARPAAPGPGARRTRFTGLGTSLPWTLPATILIVAVILVPIGIMIYSSFSRIQATGVSQGFAGFDNYVKLFREPALGQVMANTVVWVVAVVAGSIGISLALAQFLNKRFPGRFLVRWALVVPWAAALVMSATVWRYMLQGSNGILNRFLMDLGLLASPIGWYQDPKFSFLSVVIVGIIVTIPFTTYVILAGLQTLPEDVYEAAKVDGARAWRTYWSITFPLLRPSLVIATILVVVSVFNSFPVIWVITGSNTGNAADTTITWAYKIAFRQQLNPGEAAALSVLNVVFLCILVFLYFRALGRSDLGRRGAVASALARAIEPVREFLTVPRHPPRPSSGRAAAVWSRIRNYVMPLGGLLIALFFLAPYIVMFLSSFKTGTELFASPATYLPAQWEWSNWVDIWDKIDLASYIKNSLIIAIVSTLIVIAISVPAAYYTARHRFAGRGAFMGVVLVTQVIAPVAVVVGLFQEFVWVGGVHQYWSIILTNAAFNLAFSIWILSGQFESIPIDIEEAAKLDGLGAFGTMTRIALPLVRPGIVTAVVFSFIQVWNEFPVALTLFNNPNKGLQTLPVGIQQFVGLAQTEYQYLFVASLIAIIPVVILFASIEKHLIGGLTAGAVK